MARATLVHVSEESDKDWIVISFKDLLSLTAASTDCSVPESDTSCKHYIAGGEFNSSELSLHVTKRLWLHYQCLCVDNEVVSFIQIVYAVREHRM